ncbi:MAG: hypothetical protein WKG01_02995 [Kofleriaceae bacterium]
MLNLKAILTTLVLGSSSAAMANPTVQVSAEASFRIGTPSSQTVIRDHRYDRPVYTTQWTRTEDRHRYGGWNQPDYAQPVNVKLNSDSSEYTGPVFNRARGFGWSALTEPTRIEMNRQIIRLNGQFGGLMLQQVSGNSQIKMVKIRFANGLPDQTITLNQALSRASSNLMLNVQHQPIEYIVVYGTSNAGSTYRMLGA